ncbi:MAG: hypothetical protein UU74_C0033G0025 [Candidatus Woesebacteria bacterium GW2011_GWA1_41_7]|uniref:Uncharacterized protein n=1 Tax=Candidatus Woesebacteria bacterium GW2011_GWA1_41_7 TaxID=1618556 RepID=A0A0G0ZUS2_9BACT|nr:MAG: hypothetical protein UU74_C0033G0025 [Candidatus Woesebacteria bacterium GW2011_GWA1_41_7]
MGAFTVAEANAVLDARFVTGTTYYLALHTGDPGEDGDENEVLVAADADYVRQGFTFAGPAALKQKLNDSAVSWTVDAASAGYTVTHASIWTAATAGSCKFKAALAVPRALVANGVLTFEIGEVVAALD